MAPGSGPDLCYWTVASARWPVIYLTPRRTRVQPAGEDGGGHDSIPGSRETGGRRRPPRRNLTRHRRMRRQDALIVDADADLNASGRRGRLGRAVERRPDLRGHRAGVRAPTRCYETFLAKLDRPGVTAAAGQRRGRTTARALGRGLGWRGAWAGAGGAGSGQLLPDRERSPGGPMSPRDPSAPRWRRLVIAD